VLLAVGVADGAGVADDADDADVAVVVVSVVESPSTPSEKPSFIIIPEVNRFTNTNGTKSTMTIFLLKCVMRYPIKINKITIWVLFIIIYPITLNNAKRATKYRTYRFVNNFETELGIFIVYYIYSL
jgi:hypothetical protein